MRSLSVGRSRVARGAEAPADAEKIACNFLAEIDEIVVVEQPATLDVTISRELVEARARKATGRAERVAVDPDVELTIEVWPRRNLRIEGDTRAKRPIPAPGKPEIASFDVVAPAAGPAEATVTVRQGTFQLSRFDLKMEAVEQRPARLSKVSQAASGETFAGQVPVWHELEILDNETGGRFSFGYRLTLRGILEDRFESESIVGDRVAYVERLYRRIEEWYDNSPDNDELFKKQLQQRGAQLFSELFPSELQRLPGNIATSSMRFA